LYNQLGLGDMTNRHVPAKLELYSIIQIACGSNHTIALTKNETIYSWGDIFSTERQPYYQNAPLLLQIENIVSVSCGSCHTMALEKTGKLYLWDTNLSNQTELNTLEPIFSPTKINSIKYIKNMIGGNGYSMITTIFGEIYAWGKNYHGQLGLGNTFDKHEPCKLKF
jgi:alpha-tubulin suppressor-like RCC1 family protein